MFAFAALPVLATAIFGFSTASAAPLLGVGAAVSGPVDVAVGAVIGDGHLPCIPSVLAGVRAEVDVLLPSITAVLDSPSCSSNPASECSDMLEPLLGDLKVAVSSAVTTLEGLQGTVVADLLYDTQTTVRLTKEDVAVKVAAVLTDVNVKLDDVVARVGGTLTGVKNLVAEIDICLCGLVKALDCLVNGVLALVLGVVGVAGGLLGRLTHSLAIGVAFSL